MKEMLEIGKIINTHGLKGDLKVECWCDSPDMLLDIDNFYLENKKELLPVSAKVFKNNVLIHFKGIDTIEEGEKLKNEILYADKNLFELEDGVYFVSDLLGITVFDADTDKEYGKITDVLQNSTKDVYVIHGSDREYLVPAIEECIIEVDIQQKVMKIRPLRGLFD